MVVIVLPVLITQPRSISSAVFLPVVGEAIEGIKLYSFGLLFAAGFVLGVFGRGPVFLIGPATMLAFPLWSAIDMLAGGTGHNLWPFEWFFYLVESLFGLVGAAIGRSVKRRIMGVRADS
jgi:hypothetical protein